MARRASFSIHPVWVLLVILLVAGAIGAGAFLVGRVNDPYRTLTALDIPTYLENANSLRGNSYKLSGTIANYLGSSVQAGRLFSIQAGNDILPLLIPSEFNSVNIQKGQRFNFSLEVDPRGILTVKALQKA